jgi:hypothetical protein
MYTTIFLSTQEGDPSSENFSGGSTVNLFTSGSPESSLIFYDATFLSPVADGAYYGSEDDTFETIWEFIVEPTGVLHEVRPVDGSSEPIGEGDYVMLPSCSYLGEELATNPQALVKDVRAELLKLRNNPMALGAITNRIIYLIMNGQAAPRAYNTRFVKPTETVQTIYKKAKYGSDSGK